MTLFGGSVFADLIRGLSPYLDEIVFVGGWVQALYVLEVEGRGARVVRTVDIDLTLAPTLDHGERPPLLDLLRDAGFRVETFDDHSGYEVSKDSIEVDLLAEGTTSGDPVKIEGQPDLRVFGYPHQTLLRTNARTIWVGPDVHESLTKPVGIRVPTLPAYTLGKLLSSAARRHPEKQAKDLAYVTELMARDSLATTILEGLPHMFRAYPEQGRSAKRWLEAALGDQNMMGRVADQLIESSGFDVRDDTPVRAQVLARLRRLMAEGLD